MSMQIVEWREKEHWNSFVAAHSGGGAFLQSWEWSLFQEQLGKKVWRFAVIEDESRIMNQESKMLAVALVIKQPFYVGKSWLWSPRGLVIDESRIMNHELKKEIYAMYIQKVKEIAKQEKAVWWRVEPMEERTMNHESRTKEFEGLGFEEAKILRSFKQPEATLIVDLGLREEELLKRMHEKTRYNIRLAERKGVKVVNDKFQMTNDKFDEFYGLMQQTAERDGIRIVGREYYEKLFQQSSKEMNVELFCAEHEGKMLAAAVVIFFGDIATYLYGASGNEQRNLMAPYALHWEIMKEAKKRGMRWYDLWGITSLFARHPDPPVCGEGFSEASHLRPRGLDSSLKAQNDKHDWSGITRFKRGFVSLEAGKESGREVLYPGAYDYILRKAWYRLGIVGAGLAR